LTAITAKLPHFFISCGYGRKILDFSILSGYNRYFSNLVQPRPISRRELTTSAESLKCFHFFGGVVVSVLDFCRMAPQVLRP
jgi:hypothetical protein